MDHAFAVLRRYARDHGRKLSAKAEQLVKHEMPEQELFAHTRSA